MKLCQPALSLRWKIVGACLLIAIVSLTVGISFRLRMTEKLLARDFLRQADLIVWAFSRMVPNAECPESEAEFGRLNKMLAEEERVEYIVFYDTAKRVVAAFGNRAAFPSAMTTESDDPKKALADRTHLVYRLTRPIYDKAGASAGYITVGFPTKYFHDNRDQNKMDIVYTWSIVMATVLLCAYVIMGHIVKPLTILQDAMLRFGDGDLSITVPVRSRDEIGVISGEYNDMVAKVRKMYMKISEANKSLHVVNERKTEFLSTVAHDLRTPLTLIGGFAETLSNKKLELGEAQKIKYLDLILAETKKMAAFITDYLDITKIEEGVELAVMSKINTIEIARRAAAEFDFESAKVIFATRVETGAEEITADEGMIGRVLQNLIDNALKYAPQNTAITLEISRREGETVFAVSDAGQGVPDDLKEKIFEKFFSSAPANSQKRRGSGLGLAIARSIVELHGGNIRAENNSPRGSRFVFTIPDPS